MEQTQGYITGLLKRIILRQFVRGPRLQQLWSRLQILAVFGMNYGGGGDIGSSGEGWVLSEVVARACERLISPVVFDVGANVGDYSLLVRRHIPSALIYAFEPS